MNQTARESKGRANADEVFKDRYAAGQRLAEELAAYNRAADTVVLAIPKGGVCVASQVGEQLDLPLDLFVSLRLYSADDAPTIGAITYDGFHRIEEQRIQGEASEASGIRRALRQEGERAERLSFALRGRPGPPAVRDKRVIVIDDGFTTGNTVRVALEKLKQQQPTQLIAATPVASHAAISLISEVADEVHCLKTCESLDSLAAHYEAFQPVLDDEVYRLMNSERYRWRARRGAQYAADGMFTQ